jgi:hypothetical protein
LFLEYLAPSVWALIGAIAMRLDGVKAIVSTQGIRFDDYKTDVNSSIGLKFKVWDNENQARSNNFRGAIIAAVHVLGG